MLIRYDCAGNGPPVVLLHAGVADRRMWEAQWSALSARFTVIRVDLRGFGETPLPPEPYADYADVVAVLDRLDLARVSVVGSSFGGQVALEFAVRYPDRLDQVVLLCPAYRGIEPTEAARRFGTQEDALLDAGDVDGAVELNVRTWLGPEASDPARDLVRTMQRRAFEVQLAAYSGADQPEPQRPTVDPAAIAAPAVVVSGAHDLDYFRAIARHLAAAMPKATVIELPWAGHLPSLERPGEITELLITSLASDPRGPR